MNIRKRRHPRTSNQQATLWNNTFYCSGIMELYKKQIIGGLALGILGWLFVLVSMCVNGWFTYGEKPDHVYAGIFETCGNNFCFSNDVGAGQYLGKVFGFATLTSIFPATLLFIYVFKYIVRSKEENILFPGFAILFYLIEAVSGFLTVVLFPTLGKNDIENLIIIRAGFRTDLKVSFCLGLMMIGIFLNTMSMVACFLHLKNMPSTPKVSETAAANTEEVVVDPGKV
ncbi:hypothetical protein BgiBS90_022931 [Biomphalaria glabrata]|uniref:MARVEL domain-containing protein n=2 Tax=Biomphalaria glabrata TaxID=6526 RepID=A0A2C9LJS1_BIOGL|nr:hypothetical protein BgiBS90_022931 [Biomphalaria glabrata]